MLERGRSARLAGTEDHGLTCSSVANKHRQLSERSTGQVPVYDVTDERSRENHRPNWMARKW